MKQFTRLLVYLFTCLLLLSCKTTKTAVSLREKSETISLRSDRLHSFLSADTISQWLSLSYDSLVILFDEDKPLVNSSTCQLVRSTSGRLQSKNFPHAEQSMPSSDAPASDDVYFFSNNKPPAVATPSAIADGAATAHSKPTAQPQPKALKVYGLHIGASTEKKSVEQSSLTDSNVGSMQSSKRKEDNKTKSSPSSAPKYVFYILIMAAAIFFLYRLRRH